MSAARKIGKRIKYQVIYWLVKSLLVISSIVPRKWWLSFCGGLGLVARVFFKKTCALMKQHLVMAFPDKSANEINSLVKNTFRMLGKNAGDVLRASGIRSLEEMNKIMVTHGYENFEKAMQQGKGIVFIASHLGAFDLKVTNMALRGLKPNIVGTPLKDPRLNNLLWKYRNQYGAVAIERGKETFRMIKVLKSGGSVALLIDQDTKVKSVFVDFFGRPASTPVGATTLAMKTGAVVVPAYVYLGEDGLHHMHFEKEVPMRVSGNEEEDIVYNTQVLTTIIEGWIRKHPEQWVWMHRRWRTRPEAKE